MISHCLISFYYFRTSDVVTFNSHRAVTCLRGLCKQHNLDSYRGFVAHYRLDIEPEFSFDEVTFFQKRDSCKCSIGHCKRIRDYIEVDNTLSTNYFNLTYDSIISTLETLDLKN